MAAIRSCSGEYARAAGIDRYIVNDVSAGGSRGRPRTRTFVLRHPSRAGLDADFVGECDLVFAHMVFEHVADPAAAWNTVYRLLRPGGTAISFHPTLFSPPFVANWMLPERLSRPILQRFFSRRNDDDHPKFPAYYRWCRGRRPTCPLSCRRSDSPQSMCARSTGTGISTRFRSCGRSTIGESRIAEQRDWRPIVSYAYVIAVK